ncbi:transposase, IS605 OrfB family, central region [Archaeoglobus sulfaticallidus PM70-1]|uniref:Transposase, IS605 OrfB family, central region n=1 Tax=Archaeoglobus sulfaticallidus PM70-1 TaxID=387631 RepID=N0B8W4_9EURY|nr:RNA-guided endonuclease TnpB family protein [Archaeoglobus sulfaticallidus]AGK60044.1 transposase, IS605 OrfB family, central region [Archaeoglobus sulfaticallidus PM70-1]
MKVQKVIKCKVVHLTRVKRELLTQEYENLQKFLQGDNSVKLYSANKQQAKRYYKKVKPDKEYPLSIRKDLIKVERKNTKIAKYWARIPVAGRRGGIWVAIKPHRDIPEDVEICESKLFRRNGEFYLHLTIQREIGFVKVETSDCVLYIPPSFTVNERTVVIAIDIGEANPIASVELWGFGMQRRNVKFLGKEIRAIRTHYNWVRKSVGRKKIKHAVKWIKQLGNKESRKVADVLHKATRSIVDRAIELKQQGFEPIIVFGDLKNVRKPHIKGKPRCRKNNRKVHTMPSFKVKHMLLYKALWAGIPVAIVNEAWTSKQCWRCGSTNTVVRKRMFKCKDCGLEYNRDLNGSVNIGNRLLGYMLRSRADVNQPETPPVYSVLVSDSACEGRSHRL